MKKDLIINLKTKSTLSAGLDVASKGIVSWAKSIGSNLMNMWAGLNMVSGAMRTTFGLISKAISAYVAEEKAIKNLTQTLTMYGEETDKTIPRLLRIASAMQAQAGVEDDVTVARMANLRMLGVQTDLLEGASKATAGLVRSGMGEEMAMKATAAALNGNFEALGRYIPALKSANSEAEKAKIVNDFMASQWEMQKKDLETLSGSWGALQISIGDVWEELGKKIAGNQLARNSIKELDAEVKNLVADGTIDKYADQFSRVGSAISKALISVAKNPRGGLQVFTYKMIEDLRAQQKEADDIASGKMKKPEAKKESTAVDAKKEEQKKLDLLDEMMIGVKRETAKKETKIAADKAKAISDIQQGEIDRQLWVASELNKIKNREIEVDKNRIKDLKDLRRELADSQHSDAMRAMADQLAIDKKMFDEKDKIARMTVKEYLARNKDQEDADKEKNQELGKYNRLYQLSSTGAKLSTKDQKFMDAFREKERAKMEANKLLPNVINAQQALDADTRREADMATIRLEKKIDAIMKME
jgi:hypothetical protein